MLPSTVYVPFDMLRDISGDVIPTVTKNWRRVG